MTHYEIQLIIASIQGKANINMITVVVTGASGYIGGHIALRLKDSGYDVVGIDKRPCPSHLSETFTKFVKADIADDYGLSAIINVQPRAIIHCAGTSLVGPSVKDPAEYYDNNVVKTLKLLNVVRKSMPKCKFIFSSSAAVYGEHSESPLTELSLCNPISPYGESKRMIEQVMESYNHAYNMDCVSFRYFNACGADYKTRHGQEPGATHIIARVLESIRDDKEFTLYGNDYPTKDGTCVRDYVHVQDIADAHVLALYMKCPPGIYNLGSNQGTSNLEIISAAERITGKKLKLTVGPKRNGDPPTLTASANKYITIGWRKNFNLDDMIQHVWRWYNK